MQEEDDGDIGFCLGKGPFLIYTLRVYIYIGRISTIIHLAKLTRSSLLKLESIRAYVDPMQLCGFLFESLLFRKPDKRGRESVDLFCLLQEALSPVSVLLYLRSRHIITEQ